MQLAQVARRWEVLILVRDADQLDPVARIESGDHLCDDLVGCRCARRDTDDPGFGQQLVGELVGGVDASDAPVRGLSGQPFQRPGVGGVGRTDHDHRVAAFGDGEQGCLPVRGREAEVAASRRPDVGETIPHRNRHVAPVAMGQRCLGQQGDGLVERRQSTDVGHALDAADGVRCDGHRPHGFLVAGVADVHDAIALACPHAHLVMDLGDERAHRVDDVAAAFLRRGDDLRRRAVSRQHDRPPLRDVGDVVDEDDALALEALHDQLVVDDLVIAVHGRFEAAHHPRQCLDRHLDPGAEPPRLGQEHAFDRHGALHATGARAAAPRGPVVPAGGP